MGVEKIKCILITSINGCYVTFFEESNQRRGDLRMSPPPLNAAQVWYATPATNRGNFKPCSLRSRAGKISSRFSFLLRHLLACALLGDPWLSRHSPQAALSIFRDTPRTPFFALCFCYNSIILKVVNYSINTKYNVAIKTPLKIRGVGGKIFSC